MKPAEFKRVIYQAVPEAGVPLDDLLHPDYWAHVARMFNPTDRVEVLAEDGAYYAELIVQDCGKAWAKMAVLQHVPLHAVEKAGPEAAPYKVKYAGPHAMWRVFRASDNEVIQDKFQTRDQAEHYARNIESRAA